MTRVLVTGASGLLGQNVVRVASKAFEVCAVVHNHRIAYERVEVRQIDLREDALVKQLVQDTKPDWVIHCAAATAVDELERDPEKANKLNVHMSRVLAQAVAQCGARLLYVSTDSVFDGSAGPYREGDETNPKNVYARSKLEGEQAVMGSLPGALVVRTNLFGWSPGWKVSLAEWFYLNLTQGKQCPGFTDIFFSPVYAPELGKIFLRMLHESLEGIYHVPGAECVSKYEFGVRLALKFGLNEDLVIPTLSEDQKWVAERPKRTCLDGTKIADELGLDL
ncbi:MAG: SDR family oxidoreductase, partial [Anaerolineales bacterium]